MARKMIAVGFVIAIVLCATSITSPMQSHPACASGSRDTAFPHLGSECIDVLHYDLRLRYLPEQGALAGTATLDVLATSAITDGFWLDFDGMQVSGVRVDGQPVAFYRAGAELHVGQPNQKVPRGSTMQVAVGYGGVPAAQTAIPHVAPTWIASLTGNAILAQPDGASLWFPSNDVPWDKATFAITLSTPKGVHAISNGLPSKAPLAPTGSEVVTWSGPDEMSPYLAFVAFGDYTVVEGVTEQGIPYVNAVEKYTPGDAAYLDNLGANISFLERYLGPYPFASAGGVIAGMHDVGGLETATRPIISSELLRGNEDAESIVVHELAHQWFGDKKAVGQWSEIWLNEGFATYMQWLWSEDRGGPSAAEIFRSNVCPAPDQQYLALTAGPLGDRPPHGMFDWSVLQAGAMLLQALRERIGTAAFLTILKRWTSGQSAVVTTADFQSLAQQVTGQDLTTFFTPWLSTEGAFMTCRPGAPPGHLSAQPGHNRTLEVIWTAPEGAGMTAPVDGYHIAVTDPASRKVIARASTGSSTYRSTLTVPRPAAHYGVTVSAFSQAGDGPVASIKT